MKEKGTCDRGLWEEGGGILEKMLNIYGKWNTMIEELWTLIVIDYTFAKNIYIKGTFHIQILKKKKSYKKKFSSNMEELQEEKNIFQKFTLNAHLNLFLDKLVC